MHRMASRRWRLGASVKRYCTIVADPPWRIGDFPAWHRKDRRSSRERELGNNPLPYKTMSLASIKALSVGDLAALSAHLYLWTPAGFLEDAYNVVRAWGFEPQYPLVWCKAPMGTGLGGQFASNVEFILFCRYRQVTVLGRLLREKREAIGMSAKDLCAELGAHGAINHGGAVSNWENGLGCPTRDQWERLKAVLSLDAEWDDEVPACSENASRCDTRWWTWPRGKHSEKPDAFYDLVEQVSPAPYVELFARRARFGWDYWGDESLGTAEMPGEIA